MFSKKGQKSSHVNALCDCSIHTGTKKKNDRKEILAKVVEAKRRFNKNEHEWFVRPNSMAAINSNKWG